MSQNLLELVQNYFGGDTVRQASAALGESESGVGTALKSVVPLVLGGLFARSQQPGGGADLLALAQQAHSSGILGNLGGLLGGLSSGGTTAPAADGGLMSKGTDMLRTVLGGQFMPAVQGVSLQAGLQTSTVSSLMSMATPVVLGLLGRHVADNNLDATSFGSYFSSQKDSIMGALGGLPGGLGNMLSGLGMGAAATGLGAAATGLGAAATGLGAAATGLGAAATGLGAAATGAAQGVGSTVSAAANRTGDAVRSTVRETEVAASPSRWPWLLLLLLGAAAVFYYMRSCRTTPAPEADTTGVFVGGDTTSTTPPPPPPAPVASGSYDAASGNYIYDTGASTEIKLPDGTAFTVGSGSVEARLFNFLNDTTQTVSTDKTQGWMSLDRVYFNTSKATITNESQAQLQHLAAILKAFPNAAVKLGGYTDSKGKADMNMALSADRAKTARAAVIKTGISEGRVASEGYGQEHPIASNDTPEGRAQNRRIDVRVTKK